MKRGPAIACQARFKRKEYAAVKWVFLAYIVIVFLSIVIKDFRKASREIDQEEAENKRQLAEKRRTRAELTKQLEAVQTELALLERLDAQLNHDTADAAELQKLLTVTEKKNRLSEKERKLKRCLKQL